MPNLRRSAFLLAAILILLAAGSALAVRIVVETDPDDETSRLEIRNIVLPDGTEVQLFVFEATPVRLRIDDDLLEANHVEVDAENGLVRIHGWGRFETEEQTIEGFDFTIELDTESVRGQGVLITTEAIDVRGDLATRIPGRVDVAVSAFSPCSRCDQEVEDYSFRAARLQLYPGDRIVAYDVTVLLRGAAVFTLPLLVVPLGPPERQPQLVIEQGTATTRARVRLDWPYTSGPDSFGSVSLRYWADVTPGQGNLFTETLLGGGVDTNYVGGALSHRFYTDDGEGRLELGYTPAFLDARLPDGRTLDQFTVRFRYTTDPTLVNGTPVVDVLVERDDAVRQRLYEFRLGLENVVDGIRGRFFTQGYLDADPGDTVTLPSYAVRGVPERTFAQVTLEPDGSPTYSIGPFRVSGLLADIGVFEDAANPANRRVAALQRVQAGRLLERHALRLEPLTVWPGLSVNGETRFTGRYYTSGERLIDWGTRVDARQTFGNAGNLTVSFLRNVNEGETPFRFDQIPLRSRTELRAALALRPLPWFSLAVSETYVFFDSRNPREIGPGPLQTTVTLLENVDWIGIVLRNEYDLREGDPGTLTAELNLRAPDPDLIARLNLTHVQDLRPEPDRVTGELQTDTRTDVRVELGFRPYFQIDARTGYRHAAPLAGDGVREAWQPLELGLTLGTMELTDDTPGLRILYARDLNRRAMRELGILASARLGPVDVTLEQRMNFLQNRLGTSRYAVVWRGVLSLEATGFAVLPPRLFALERDDAQPETWTVTLRDAPEERREQWRLTYSTVRDRAFVTPDGTVGGFRGSRLEGFVTVEYGRIWDVAYSIDLYADVAVRDDALARTYLRRASLRLWTDVFDRVGIQGSFGYTGRFSTPLGEVDRATLTLQNVAITVRVLDELYVSAIFNDVWELTGAVPDQSPWNLQPILYVVWDRCCWALYGSWNTRTGAFSVAVGAPGGSQGIQTEFETPLLLPGRDR